MKKPKIINLFIDYSEEFSLLSDAQAGRLIKGLLSYAGQGEQPDFSDDKAVCVLFSVMKKQVDRDFDKYAEQCEKRVASAKKAAAARYAKRDSDCDPHANACDSCQDNNKHEDKNEDDDKYNDNDKYNDDNRPDARSAQDGQAGLTEDILIVGEIIDYLNQQADTRYQPTAGSTRRLISALIKDGYTLEDMKQVVDRKCREWKHTEYQKYLRPETLFGNKFDSYLNTSTAATLPQRKPGSAWYRQDYAETIRRWNEKSLFDD